MNTHLLISIKDIEDKIQRIIMNNKHLFNDKEYMKEYYPEAYQLEELLNNSKQISLDDEGIEDKAENFYQSANDSTISGFVDGYTQALKDLL